MKRIRINHPGDGDWVMGRVEGFFNPLQDHVIANYDDETDELLGGFVLTGFLGTSLTVHQAGDGDWCSRALLWMLFGYAFHQLKCHKIFGTVAADNYHALDINLRGGWELETVVQDVYGPGRHMMLLSMKPGTCRWLKLKRPPEALFTTTVGDAESHG
jgi:hypothetical protein